MPSLCHTAKEHTGSCLMLPDARTSIKLSPSPAQALWTLKAVLTVQPLKQQRPNPAPKVRSESLCHQLPIIVTRDYQYPFGSKVEGNSGRSLFSDGDPSGRRRYRGVSE